MMTLPSNDPIFQPDNAEHKQVEDAQRKSDAKYQAIFENAPVGIFQSSPQGRFENVNSFMARMFGYDSPREMIASIANISRQIYVDASDRQAFQRILAEEGEVLEFIGKNRRKDGTVIWTQTTARAEKDVQGNILYYEGFIADVTAHKQAEDALQQTLDQLEQRVAKRTEELTRLNAELQTEIAERKQAEESLKKGEQKFREIFDNANDAIYIMELTEGGLPGKFKEVNDVACNMLGYSAQEFLEMSPVQINAEDISQKILRMTEPLLSQGHAITETVHRSKDGRTIPVEINSRVVNIMGEPRILSIVRDITKRKQSEEALKESEARYRTVTQSAHDAIISADSSGKIVGWNRGAEAIFGYSEAEVLDQPLTTLMPPHFQFAHLAAQERRANKQSGGESYSISKSVEVEGRRKDGSEFPLEISLANWQVNGRQFFTAILRDITGRKQAEQRLKDSEERYRTLFQKASDGIFYLSTDLRVLAVNESFARMHGYDVEEMRNMRLQDLDTSESAKLSAERIRRVMVGETIEFEVEHYHKDGHVFPLAVSTSLISVGGQLLIQAFHRDITERRQAEAALRESEAFTQAILKNSPIGISVRSRTGKLLSANDAWRKIWAIPESDLQNDITRDRSALNFDKRDDYLASHQEEVRRVYEQGGYLYLPELKTTHVRPGGAEWISQYFYSIQNEQGQVERVVILTENVTERKHNEDQLRQLSSAVEHGPAAIMVTDVKGCIEYVNPKFIEITGYTLDELRGLTPRILKSGNTPPEVYSELWQTILSGKEWRGEFMNRKKNGDLYWEFVSISAITDSIGIITHFVSAREDITERKATEEKIRLLNLELEHLARIDELTGINNRRSLFELAEREFNMSMRYRPPLSMLMFDIDDFKKINDTFGHALGDQVLTRVAQVVCAEIRSADIVGRYGGDEFVVLLPQTGVQEALILSERIQASICAMRLETNQGPLGITISIGIAQTLHQSNPNLLREGALASGCTPPPDTKDHLFLRADQALYAAKQAGKKRTVVFDQEAK